MKEILSKTFSGIQSTQNYSKYFFKNVKDKNEN